MTPPERAQQRRETSRKLTRLRQRGGTALTIAIAAPLISGAFLIGYAGLLAHTLGRTIQDGATLDAIWPLVLALGAIVIVRSGLGVIGEQAGQIGAERIKASLRSQLFDHVLAQRRGLGLAPASGATSAAIVDQIEGLENFFARYLPAMIGAAVLPVAFSVIMIPIDWVVGLLFLLTAPLIPVFMALAGWGAQAATDHQANALTRLSAHFSDRLRGLLTLKLFGRQAEATRDVYEASENLRRRTNAVLRIAFLSSAILEFFAALGVAGVALYVGLTFLGFIPFHPELTLVSGLFALIMAPEVYNPLRQLAAHYHDRATAKSALAEIEEQIGGLETLGTRQEGTYPSESAGALSIAINALTVTTPEGRKVLDDLALVHDAGRSLAVMGESGIGKSTLARVLARLLPATGSIALGGTPLSDWDEADLRASVTYIAQKPRIFAGTIFDNIAFARQGASAQAVAAAAELALVTPFAASLPDGLHTVVGEGGLGLSGGQIQRIGLARLFLTNPGLIILDEPTAHLDDQTQEQLLDAVFEFAKGRTLIVLTHADAVARRADRMQRMAGGRLLDTPHRRPQSTKTNGTGTRT